jgi:hypothetical protein
MLKEKMVGVPALIILDKENNIISTNARGQVEKNQDCINSWL